MKKYALHRPYVVLGEHLARARATKGLTQRQVSLQLGYAAKHYIWHFEQGIAAPPLKKLKLLVKIYDLNVDAIVDIIQEAQKEILLNVLKPQTHSPLPTL